MESVPVGYMPIAFLALIVELAAARFLGSDLELVPEPCPWWQVASTAATTGGLGMRVRGTVIRCSTGCTRIPTGAENRRTGEPERRRQSGADTNDRERRRNSTLKPDPQQRHQECTKRSPAIGAVHVPRSGRGAGTPGACRTRTEVRAALGSTGTAT